MDESCAVDRDADMQLFVSEMHEDEIAATHFAARDRLAAPGLLESGTRHVNARAIRSVCNQPAAVEAPGGSPAEAIRLSELGHGEIHHEIPLRGRTCRRGRYCRVGRALGIRRIALLGRRARTCAERHDQRGRGHGFEQAGTFDEARVIDQAGIVANAAPTIPASERKVPMHNRVSQ
jgi:hypothetical protein